MLSVCMVMLDKPETDEAPNALRKILIVGGGSAGWMTAVTLFNAVGKSCEIHLVESKDVPTVGVGEATIPPIRLLNSWNGITEAEFLRETSATYKLGIKFENWSTSRESYFHPFGSYGVDGGIVAWYLHWLAQRDEPEIRYIDEYCLSWRLANSGKFTHPSKDSKNVLSRIDYAYHFDATKYASFLRKLATKRGVHRYEGHVDHVDINTETGAIDGVRLKDGRQIEADFFIDCTGFNSLLISDALDVKYESWNKWLPSNRAVAAPSKAPEATPPLTVSTALDMGWQWSIPLQDRMGNGIVYSSDFSSDDYVESTLRLQLGDGIMADPKLIKFNTGHRNKFWKKNCLAIGLSAGFLEPLESTSLHMIQTAIMRFLALFPCREMRDKQIEEYNRQTRLEYEYIRDFLILHYAYTGRDDSEMWRFYADLPKPDSLIQRVELFRNDGYLLEPSGELFLNDSWVSVMIGQGILPKYDSPIASLRRPDKVSQKMKELDTLFGRVADSSLPHALYIRKVMESKTSLNTVPSFDKAQV